MLKLIGSKIATRIAQTTNQKYLCSVNRFASSAEQFFEKQLKKFQDEKVSEPENSLELILAHVLKKKTLREVRGEELKKLTLNDEQLQKLETMCDCRMALMPVQYILRNWEFRDLNLAMEIPVFIPRPETEELVELITQQLDPKRNYQILDVGCGSGNICLSLLNSLPNVKQIIAIDQMKAACELTLYNANQLELASRLRVFKHKLESDILPCEISSITSEFDLIVSNPPYVPTKDIFKMQPEIYLYEDTRALDGGPDGLTMIKILLELASKYLKKSGTIWLEVDSRHPEIIAKLVENNSKNWQLKYVSSYKDIFQKERFVEITKE